MANRKKTRREKAKDAILFAGMFIIVVAMIVSADVDKCSDCTSFFNQLFVPYTGAIGNVDLGEWNLSASSLLATNESVYIGEVKLSSSGDILKINNGINASKLYGDGHHISNLSFESVAAELYYGEVWNGTTTLLEMTSVGVWENYTNLVPGLLYGFSFKEGDGNCLTSNFSGKYLATMTISFSASSGIYDIAIAKNYIPHDKCTVARTLASGIGNMGMTCLLDLAADDTITPMIRDTDNPLKDVTVYDINLNVVKVGI